jgi:nucleolar protein 6
MTKKEAKSAKFRNRPKSTEDKVKQQKSEKHKRRETKEENFKPERPAKITKPAPKTKARFILFVGNLAYTTTNESIASHFSQIKSKPTSIRIPTTLEENSKSKGYAFVEYDNSTALKKALRLHHTLLDGRKISVELTAGGGGNNATRKAKIKEKNSKLAEERKGKQEDGHKTAKDTSSVHPSRLKLFL